MDLHNRVVVIAGASGGIGSAIAQTLAREGARLVLTARHREKLRAIAQNLEREFGTTIQVIPGDVTSEADCKAVARATIETFGTIDVLVNSAGYAPPAPLTETTEVLWDATIDVCLKGVYLMTRAVIGTMIDNKCGAIINISSGAGLTGISQRSAYCAAKWGVQGFSEALRAELTTCGIRVHTINPSAVATAWWENINSPKTDDLLAKMIRPEEVAEAVRWLLIQPDRIQIDSVTIKTLVSPWK